MGQNSYELAERKVIPAVLVYLFHEEEILMIFRNTSHPGRIDDHQGKWNGIGGKCELDESFLDAGIREVQEESGIALSADRFHSLGIIQFPKFKAQKNEDWIVTVWYAEIQDVERSHAFQSCEEGDLSWIPKSKIPELSLWPGDRYFIEFVLNKAPFIGTIWYQSAKVVKYSVQPIK